MCLADFITQVQHFNINSRRMSKIEQHQSSNLVIIISIGFINIRRPTGNQVRVLLFSYLDYSVALI